MNYFHIDKNKGSIHIYQQIYNNFIKLILDGEFSTHYKLPSKRELAEDLNVSINAVANAYGQLLEEGYIYTVERKGYFVEDITQFISLQPNKKHGFPQDLKEQPETKDGWISLSHISTDSTMFPYHKWVKCIQKSIKHHQQDLAKIPHPQGPYLVRKSIAIMVSLSRGVICEPEQIVIGTGTQPLIQQLVATQPENIKAAVENPGYARIYKLLKGINIDTFTVNLDEQGIDVKEVQKLNPNFLFITPSHQFPNGTIMPISRRIELLNWASMSKDRYIVEDDYDSEFKYGTDNIPSLHSLDRNQSVIYVGTFSKTLLPSFRMSYMVLPPEMLRGYRQKYSNWIHGSNTLDLLALSYFIDSGEYAKHIKKMSNHYNMKRKELIKELESRFGDNIKITNVPAGLHFLAEFKTDKGYQEIEERAKKERIEIYTIRRFILEGENETKGRIQLVLGFASIKSEQIKEAVNRLKRVI
ncbi:PLP-dependent aminotransferase family protein [Bacillus sp. MRMR6]|uniref:MocR-like transcriptional regulator GabR n=1 Tax=Bacillus sp. MRMR6 TaxID=1928617 RepID=UPI0009536134|nr:PLP-dependent aminotransferase family protein [Bacillus sp. MRMR6]OLS33425.1 GntR family transcriptional regulator [Bacillus sp. MRMR6]